MKKYEVEIARFPLLYLVEANSPEEAEEKASKMFADETLGESIYEVSRIESQT